MLRQSQSKELPVLVHLTQTQPSKLSDISMKKDSQSLMLIAGATGMENIWLHQQG